MCQLAAHHGTGRVTAVSHQNDQWPRANRASILSACAELRQRLSEARIDLEVVPAGEVLLDPDLKTRLNDGELLTIGDHGKHLLVEFPPSFSVDVSPLFRQLIDLGVRPVLAHPERYEHLVAQSGAIEALIESGALMQVNAGSVTGGSLRRQKVIQDWFQRGIVHLIGSDGHRLTRRKPVVDEAFKVVNRWIGKEQAEAIFCTNGAAILEGKQLHPPPPRPRKKKRLGWF